jgi:hypothetical protein
MRVSDCGMHAHCLQFCYLSGGVVLCVAYCTDIEAWSPSLNWLRIKVAAEVFIFFFLAVLLSQDMVRNHCRRSLM